MVGPKHVGRRGAISIVNALPSALPFGPLHLSKTVATGATKSNVEKYLVCGEVVAPKTSDPAERLLARHAIRIRGAKVDVSLAAFRLQERFPDTRGPGCESGRRPRRHEKEGAGNDEGEQ